MNKTGRQDTFAVAFSFVWLAIVVLFVLGEVWLSAAFVFSGYICFLVAVVETNTGAFGKFLQRNVPKRIVHVIGVVASVVMVGLLVFGVLA